ncbi:hypothetical protein LTR12_006004 [Friedmanniomyces endolithicus]|nr:hypothetical protein LTR12_006004 [Friedmanniomyces endolithicus]
MFKEDAQEFDTVQSLTLDITLEFTKAHKGTTQQYVSSLQTPMWNLRAISNFEDRKAPKTGQTPFLKALYLKKAIKQAKVRQWRDEQAILGLPIAGKQKKKSVPLLRQRSASERNANVTDVGKAAGSKKTSLSGTATARKSAGVIDLQLLALDDAVEAEVAPNDLDQISLFLS